MTDPTRDVSCHVLDGAERGALRDQGVRAAPLVHGATRVRGRVLSDVLPRLTEFLTDFAEHPPRAGAALVRGVPVDDLPATPHTSTTTGHLAGHASTGTMFLVAEALGSLIGYADEKAGALLHEVHPVRGQEQRIENSGSTTFGFHTENVHHPLRPDFLGLLCLRQDHDRTGAARLASVREAVGDIPAHHLRVLRSPRFHSLYPTSFDRVPGEPRPRSGPHPAIIGDGPDATLRFNVHNTLSSDGEGAAALLALADALHEHRRQILLEPGDLLIIDNRVAAHGRSAFTPRYDGHDRWLRRFYARRQVPSWVRDLMTRERVVPSMSELRRAAPESRAIQQQ